MRTKSITHKGKCKVLVPLSNFTWLGKDFQIDNLCIIKKLSLDEFPDLPRSRRYLSESDFDDDLVYTTHCLSFEQSSKDVLSPTEKINIFLLALWIARPTRVQVHHRFELHDGYDRSARLLGRFQWIKPQAKKEIETKHLQKMNPFVDSLKAIYIARKRLRNSIVLTFSGCSTIHWQVAFICFCAAAEGILTYEKGPGITRRLAKSFACLTKKTKSQRDLAYGAFCHSYNIRSDIMHGRIVSFATKRKSLRELGKVSNILRDLWKIILSSESCINELGKDDAGRKSWFSKNENGYEPPRIDDYA